MTDHIASRAGFLAALSADDPERQQAVEHARSCGACRAALDEGARLVALLKDAAPTPAGVNVFDDAIPDPVRRHLRDLAACPPAADRRSHGRS